MSPLAHSIHNMDSRGEHDPHFLFKEAAIFILPTVWISVSLWSLPRQRAFWWVMQIGRHAQKGKKKTISSLCLHMLLALAKFKSKVNFWFDIKTLCCGRNLVPTSHDALFCRSLPSTTSINLPWSIITWKLLHESGNVAMFRCKISLVGKQIRVVTFAFIWHTHLSKVSNYFLRRRGNESLSWSVIDIWHESKFLSPFAL